MSEVQQALPDNLSEILGALVSLIVAIWGAFKRGKAVGRKSAE